MNPTEKVTRTKGKDVQTIYCRKVLLGKLYSQICAETLNITMSDFNSPVYHPYIYSKLLRDEWHRLS